MHRECETVRTRSTPDAVGVLGGSGCVGRWLLSRFQAGRGQAAASRVEAFSRRAGGPDLSPGPRSDRPAAAEPAAVVRWHRLGTAAATLREPTARWVTCCPLWAVVEQLPLLEAAGARRVVALSSTSRFTKIESLAAADRALAARLARAEEQLGDWAGRRGVDLTLLRPTLVYDAVHDGNVAAIARFIRRWGFFPVVGPAAGLRQPVHADDVAAACQAALAAGSAAAAYSLSGGERLPYRELVQRIFAWLGIPPRLVSVPLAPFRAAGLLARRLPRLAALHEIGLRMNRDLIFDHAPASRDLGFQPRPFVLPSCAAADHAAWAAGRYGPT